MGLPLPLDSFTAHVWSIYFAGFSRQIYTSWGTCSRRSLHFQGGWVCLEGRSETFRGMSYLVSWDRQLWFFKHGVYIFSHLFDDYKENVCIHSYVSLKLLHSSPSRFHRQLTSIVMRRNHTWIANRFKDRVVRTFFKGVLILKSHPHIFFPSPSSIDWMPCTASLHIFLYRLHGLLYHNIAVNWNGGIANFSNVTITILIK